MKMFWFAVIFVKMPREMMRTRIKNPVYNTSFWLGYLRRYQFMRRAFRLPPVETKKTCDLTVYSTTGKSQIPEQIVSIRNFLRYVGAPKQFVVFSDGSLSEEEKKALESIHESVKCGEIAQLDLSQVKNKEAMLHFIGPTPFITKLKAILHLSNLEGSRLYLDSDILFFPESGEPAFPEGNSSLYLKDCQFSMDKRLLQESELSFESINAGLILFRGEIDWSVSAERAAKVATEVPDHFSEQTLVHLALHNSKAQALDAQKFMLQTDDVRKWKDYARVSGSTARHYVGPVRHKMWLLPASFYS